MKFVTGCSLFFDLKIFEEIGFFDEKIFLYYEENDFYERCLSKKNANAVRKRVLCFINEKELNFHCYYF